MPHRTWERSTTVALWVVFAKRRIDVACTVQDAHNVDPVTDRQVDHGHLFHTLLQAVGVQSAGEFEIGGRTYPVADPAKGPIQELLA